MNSSSPSAGDHRLAAGDGRHKLAHDLVLPTLLFASLGGMTWAVRGCSGFGAVAGCVFAGVTWGAAWWFISLSPDGERRRRYDSGWVVLALTLGIGLSGARGWMQWHHFFEGRLLTDAGKGTFVPIPRVYGFVWLFIAGVPWAGIGACLLAWCGSIRETRIRHWALRITCGFGGYLTAKSLFASYPGVFLPLYDSIPERYLDLAGNPTLRRVINDCGAAVAHMGAYLGLLSFEVIRKEWKNVVLIVTVGVVNGAGWALCQNWTWAQVFWPNAHFNFWRCWESSGGISIGIAYGIAYALVNREMSDGERAALAERDSAARRPGFDWLLIFLALCGLASLLVLPHLGGWGNLDLAVLILFGGVLGCRVALASPGTDADGKGVAIRGWVGLGLSVLVAGTLFLPDGRGAWACLMLSGALLLLGGVYESVERPGVEGAFVGENTRGSDLTIERFGLYLGLLTGLGLSLRNGLKGWFNIYLGDEDFWGRRLWEILGPTYLVCLLAIVVWLLARPAERRPAGPRFPHAYGLMWTVLIVQNVVAQLVTGPPTEWNEVVFSLYYVILFSLSGTIVFHFQVMRVRSA